MDSVACVCVRITLLCTHTKWLYNTLQYLLWQNVLCNQSVAFLPIKINYNDVTANMTDIGVSSRLEVTAGLKSWYLVHTACKKVKHYCQNTSTAMTLKSRAKVFYHREKKAEKACTSHRALETCYRHQREEVMWYSRRLVDVIPTLIVVPAISNRQALFIRSVHVNKINVIFALQPAMKGQREQRYSSIPSLTSALDVQRQTPAIFPPEKRPVHMTHKAGWAPGPV